MLIVMAIALVILAAVLAGVLDGWSAVPLALSLQYLGVALLALTTVGVLTAAEVIVVAAGVVGVALASPPRPLSTRGGEGAARRFAPPFFSSLHLRWRGAGGEAANAFQVRWFDLSVIAVAIVGAVDLATARPVFGGGVDVVFDVLICTGVLYCLIGRSARLACGLLFLVSAGSVALHEVGPSPSRIESLLLALVQLILVLALTHLHLVEEQRSPDRKGVVTASSDGDDGL